MNVNHPSVITLSRETISGGRTAVRMPADRLSGYTAPAMELLDLETEAPIAQSQLEEPVINPPAPW